MVVDVRLVNYELVTGGLEGVLGCADVSGVRKTLVCRLASECGVLRLGSVFQEVKGVSGHNIRVV